MSSCSSISLIIPLDNFFSPLINGRMLSPCHPLGFSIPIISRIVGGISIWLTKSLIVKFFLRSDKYSIKGTWSNSSYNFGGWNKLPWSKNSSPWSDVTITKASSIIPFLNSSFKINPISSSRYFISASYRSINNFNSSLDMFIGSS